MSTVLIEIRRAKPSDAGAVADAHDEAWRTAYQGIIPGTELDRLINRRGPAWWDSAIRKGSRIALLQFGDKIAGYANYGRNRARSLHYDGEIYELYLRPEFQGLGFGRRLFTAARRDLAQSGLKSLIVWALSENETAVEFYRALGGKTVARSSEKVRHPRARQGRIRLEQLSIAAFVFAFVRLACLSRGERSVRAARRRLEISAMCPRRNTKPGGF